MIRKIKADGVQEVEFLAKLGERSRNTNKDVTETVSEIINNVMMNGDKAVREYTIKFDGKAPDAFEVPKEELTALTADCDPEFIATLKKAADNIRNFHERQKQQSWLTTKDNGVIMGQRIRGLKRVGLYVPGGTAAYPSSVLMNAIPAKIAGVSELIMVTPPGKDGKPKAIPGTVVYIHPAGRYCVLGFDVGRREPVTIRESFQLIDGRVAE